MKKLTLLAVLMIGVLAFAQKKADQQPKSDPWAGTWKMDVAKSKLHGPAPKEEIVTSEGTGPNGDIVKFNITAVRSDGTTVHESFDGKADGQPYPFIANGQEVAKNSYRRVSPHQYSGQGTGADGSTSSETITLSKDGKTITIQSHSKGQEGEYDETVIYNKQ